MGRPLLTDRSRRVIEVQPERVEYPPVHKPRVSISISPTTIALALVSVMMLMTWAGREVGWLMGNGIIWSVGAIVLFLMWRDGKGLLTSTLGGICAILAMFATNAADNVMSTSIQFGYSLQRISQIGFVIIPMWLIASLFQRRKK